MRFRIIVAALAVVVVCSGVGVAVAAMNGNFSTHLQGRYEMPVMRDTDAQGQATFKLSDDGQSVDYKLIASNIDNADFTINPTTPGSKRPLFPANASA